MACTVRLDAVGRSFRIGRDTLQAVAPVTAELAAGTFTAIIGPSGCGKSTLLRMIADILPPTEGRITIDGAPPAAVRLARGIGFVFQEATLLPWLSVVDNVAMPLRIAGRSELTVGLSPRALLKLVGLEGFEKAKPSQLSGGMQQRAAIARALVLEPKVLLLDEPFGALDEITRQGLNLELLRIWQATGTTAVLVTHSLSEAVFMADRVLVMSPRPGRILRDIAVELPRPRRLDQMRAPAFLAAVDGVREALFGREAAPAPPQPVTA